MCIRDRLNLVSRENLTGMMVIRAFGNEEREEKRFDEVNTELARMNRFVFKTMSVTVSYTHLKRRVRWPRF